MKSLLRVVAVLLAIALAALLLGLSCVHIEIRSLAPAPPEVARVVSAWPASADLPVRVTILNTASQRTTRAGVLEPSLDPDPDAPYTMSVPAFALEWADGRLFLIDLGMGRAEAAAFGAPSELLFDAEPMEALGDVAEQLGAAADRVAGIAFTHLHTDHTNGSIALCRGRPSGETVALFQGALQADSVNYTTRPGVDHLEEAGCLVPERLEGEGLVPIPGFDGLALVPIAGHTPGSQVFVARMAEGSAVRTWVFTGDAVNHVEGALQNLPKPTLYSLLVVPESPDQLERVRRWLGALAQQPGVGLLVSHDQLQLEGTALPFAIGSAPAASVHATSVRSTSAPTASAPSTRAPSTGVHSTSAHSTRAQSTR